jgi:hypothetical protein
VAVGLIGTEAHPTEGETRTLRSSIIVDGQASTTSGFTQPKGWESHDVAKDLGFSKQEVDALFANQTLITTGRERR